MTVYRLSGDLVFPPPEEADPGGLLAVGGDLSSDRLLLAYSLGIFPWYDESQPILWHAPDPRAVLLPSNLHVPPSAQRAPRAVADHRAAPRTIRHKIRRRTPSPTSVRGCACLTGIQAGSEA